MSSMEKPLPEIPSGSRTSRFNLTLTIEARAHLHRFIVRALDEEGDVRDRDTWAERIEAALDELGASISRGGWLAGLRRGRYVRRRHHEEVERQKAEEKAKREKEDEEKAKGKTAKGRSKMREVVLDDSHIEDAPTDEQLNTALEQLRGLLAKPFIPTPKPSVKHLVLITSGFASHHSDPTEDMGFRLVRPAIGCTFKVNEFSLPNVASPADESDNIVLYGLQEWDACLLSCEDPIQLVGGTFQLKGLTSVSQYAALSRVLRLATYTHLSLLLEQDLLANSHVELHYPKPVVPSLPTFPVERSSSTPDVKGRGKRDSGSGIWSYLTKKTEDLLQRATNVAPVVVRRGSLELPLADKFSRHTSLPHRPDSSFMPRRLSLLSTVSSRLSQDDSGEPHQLPYSTGVRRIDSWKDLLSTTPGVAFSPPRFLLDIAEQERKNPSRRLAGDEKAALTSLLGWQGKESLMRGMVGMSGFVRHQGFSVLYSEHVPGASSIVSQPPTPGNSTASSEIQFPLRIACGGHRRRWLHFRYYQQHGRQWDETLGEAVIRWCMTAEDPCIHPDCRFQRSEHDMRWIHGGVRLIATVSLPNPGDSASLTKDDAIYMWHSCSVCGKESHKEVMHDGTYLFSFAKYLELLVYAPAIHVLQPPLCEHAAFPPKPWPPADTPIPQARFRIIRKFSYQGRTVTFTLSEVKDIFEIRVPRLQILRRKAGEKKAPEGPQRKNSKASSGSSGDDRRALRREIMRWWQGLSEHMDQLEDKFITESPRSYHKSLPRLPSADDDDADDDDDDDTLSTPRGRPIPPPATPSTPTPRAALGAPSSFPFLSIPSPGTSASSGQGSISTPTLTPSPDDRLSSPIASADDADSLRLLSGLRHKFQRTEQELYSELAHTSDKNLNDVRRSFVTAARGATRRLAAWEKKHGSHLPAGTSLGDAPITPEPEWWKSGCHAVPGGSVIVREDDWGSIIAFTLSSVDYQRELSNMNSIRVLPPSAPPTTPTVTRPSLFRAGESLKRLVSGAPPQPDPDHDDIGWQEPESYSAVISRKEHPREPVSLISIGGVLRQKASTDVSSTSSLISPIGSPGARPSGMETPRSVRAKPAVEVTNLAADGRVSGMPEAVEAAGKILHDLEAVSKPSNSSRTSLTLSESRPSSSGIIETHIRRGKASSIVSDSDGSTVGLDSSGVSTPPPPPPPPKDGEDARKSALSTSAPSDSEPPQTPAKPGTSSTFTAAFTNSLTSAMRYVLKPDQQRPSSATPHHGLLSADSPPIDDRPHIKYDWTIGKRLRFSCTVYYAKQFDQLRKRCGVEDVFLKSLSRSENWAAEGGKSRSNFWKTTDNRFIIKTLVNAWNVADLQVLIDLGPSYFKHMEATASRPTVLAKLLGFYTVEIRNLESGNTQAKADLLVMENLFYNAKVSKTFDLKGIQGRKVKASSGTSSKTLFDGEWIEGQQKALTLVRPHSKVILHEAIKADCDFLARSNIMDYSLLLGIDDENKQMICGLVDTIGSYTFAKTLEYKAKQGLNAGKEVTVVPPHEYQERFVAAMDEYFLACPGQFPSTVCPLGCMLTVGSADKWSKPLDNTIVPSDCRDLPSVL
ncbi:hypothetical protein FKP32DRAFT_1632308 [Trametes sanguinea]|nr:hypothetical protein FKP32DRAFT_1632308 [Trametes sanguinea]